MSFDAKEFLQSLFATAVPEELPAEWVADYQERAAILEFDGDLSRKEAEVQAKKEIIMRMRSSDEVFESVRL